MAEARELATVADWEQLWKEMASPAAAPLMVVKLSPYCGISLRVESVLGKFLPTVSEDAKVRFCCVNVVSSRDVSRRIAADVKIPHQSPQAILIAAGQKPVWNASHGALTAAAFEDAVKLV